MPLTEEQRNAVTADGHVSLTSCPGSGKTRVIVARLLRSIDAVRQSTRRIACITHTNAAADEIELRVRESCFTEEADYYEISTIHGFALKNIVAPYASFLPEFASGFTLLTGEDQEFADRATAICGEFGIQAHPEDFGRIQRHADGSLSAHDRLPLALREEWCRRLDADARIAVGEIVFHGVRLLEAFPQIASALASHFATVLVDEFQDSTPEQVLVFSRIASFGRTLFFCVGDPDQSIYGFAGASPELMPNFAAEIAANTEYTLTGNFRSSTQVCDIANRLRRTGAEMAAVGPAADCTEAPLHVITTDVADQLIADFIPRAEALEISRGQIAVLASTWPPLFHLARQLRQRGVAAIGPGSRPYRRAHLIGHLLEPIGAYLESPEPHLGVLVQRGLAFICAQMSDHPPKAAFDYSGRLIVCRLLAAARAARNEHNLATAWVHHASEAIADILAGEKLLTSSKADELRVSGARMVDDIHRNAPEATVADIGVFARRNECVQLMTVHQAKGREFDAVTVIDVNDDRFPHYSIRRIADTGRRAAEYDESRRCLYVAATRAKRLLMFVSGSTDWRTGPSPFLAEMGF